MGVAAQLAISALAEPLEDIGEDGDRLVAIVRPLQHQPQQIASDQPVAPFVDFAEDRLIADGDAMFVHADLAAPGPIGLVDDDLVGFVAPGG